MSDIQRHRGKQCEKECQDLHHQNPGERHGGSSLSEPPRGTNSVNTLILTLFKQKIVINFCCFKSPSVWQFAVVDLGN